MERKDDNTLATVADLEAWASTIKKEVGDIVREAPKLTDGDPSNNGPALREIAQSVSVIVAAVGVATAAAVITLQNLGVI